MSIQWDDAYLQRQIQRAIDESNSYFDNKYLDVVHAFFFIHRIGLCPDVRVNRRTHHMELSWSLRTELEGIRQLDIAPMPQGGWRYGVWYQDVYSKERRLMRSGKVEIEDIPQILKDSGFGGVLIEDPSC